MNDVAERVAGRIQLTSDGRKACLEAVEGAFGADVDYAMLNRIYRASSESAESRCSPGRSHRDQEVSCHRQAGHGARLDLLQRVLQCGCTIAALAG